MTPYETQSLAIAQNSLYASYAATCIALAALAVVIIGGIIAYKNVQASKWNTLLSFEQDMASRRSKFSELKAKINAASKQGNVSFDDLKEMFDEAKESYFNSLDRLASSILNGNFPDKEMRQDYQEAITEVVRAFPQDFATGTRFRKVVRLHNRWHDQI